MYLLKQSVIIFATIFLTIGQLSAANLSNAGGAPAGPGGTGGGTGCRGNFMAAAHQVSLWLEVNGGGLKPRPITSKEFLSAITDPKKDIQLIPETEPLTYRNEDVTAFFDGDKIKVRCDRLNKENPIGLKRVVAHEIFRKLYEMGHAIFRGI